MGRTGNLRDYMADIALSNIRSGGGSNGGGSIDPSDIEKIILYFGFANDKGSEEYIVTDTIEIPITNEVVDCIGHEGDLLYAEVICKNITPVININVSNQYVITQFKYNNVYYSYIGQWFDEGRKVYFLINYITGDHLLNLKGIWGDNDSLKGEMICKTLISLLSV